jgi:hypothetical protein
VARYRGVTAHLQNAVAEVLHVNIWVQKMGGRLHDDFAIVIKAVNQTKSNSPECVIFSTSFKRNK